jgi:sulfide:quinone oxidoreductase
MKTILILGAGTAGTAIAHKLRRGLSNDWEVAVVDPSSTHLYQPGLLFLPFGDETEERILRERGSTLGKGITWHQAAVKAIDTESRRVELVEGVVEMPIKCPVAPLEFAFLADAYLTKRGIRDKTELVYATPLDGAFTKPLASKTLGYLLENKGIQVETEFMTGEVDSEKNVIRSYDEREVPYDLLVTIPPHMGARFLEDTDLADELAFVATDPYTLAAKNAERVFVIGDATDLPSSKAGSVAHFQADLMAENILRAIDGQELEPTFDGHSNCFVETGHGKAMLIDFNYETEPLPGQFPIPGIGPLPLLKEARRNHWAKRLFRLVYWHGLLPARPIPISPTMSMAGKQLPAAAE